MSKQIGFILTKEEENSVIDFILSQGLLLFNFRNDTANIPVQQTDDIHQPQQYIYYFAIKPEDVKMSKFTDTEKNISYYRINDSISYIFELSRTVWGSTRYRIWPGRIYFQTSRYDKQGINHKINDGFQKVYASVSNYIKKITDKKRRGISYISKDMERLMKEREYQ